MGNPTDTDPRLKRAETSPQGPKSHDRPDDQATAGQQPDAARTRDDAEIVIENLDAAFHALRRDRQTLAYLGFAEDKHDVESRRLPGQSRIVTISSHNADTSRVNTVLQDSNLTRPLTPLLRNPEDSTTTTQHIVSDPGSLIHLLNLAQNQGLPVILRTSATNSYSQVIRIGGQVFAVDPVIFDTVIDSIPETAQLEVLAANGEKRTTITPRLEGYNAKFWSPEHSSVASVKLAKKAIAEELDESMLGGCTFLSIDLSTLLKIKEEKAIQHILSQIEALSKSPDYIFRSDDSGNITIIALAQRSGGFLTRLSDGINKATGNKTNQLIGGGNLKMDANGVLAMEGYTNPSLRAGLKKLTGMYIRREDDERFKVGRDTTTAHTETEAVPNIPELLKITKVERGATLRVGGGPDKLIGYKEELDQLRAAIDPKSKSRLIVLKGHAGRGKSRLLSELAAENPSMLKISIDPAGENIQGYAMVSIADQLATFGEKHLPQRAKSSSIYQELLEFSQSSEAEKIEKAQTKPRDVAKLIFHTLKIFEAMLGSFTLAIDDTHHIDRHSDPLLMEMLHNFLRDSKNSTKVLLSLRPEERYKSAAQSSLESKVRSFGKGEHLCTVNLENPETGEPKLDLRNPDVAYEYIWHSLPEDIRTNNKIAPPQPRKLIDLHTILAEKINSPFELTSLINIILRDKRNLIVNDEGIFLHPNAIRKIDKIKNSEDLAIFHREKIRRLKRPHKKTLQLMALLGSKVPITQFLTVVRNITGETTNLWSIITELKLDGYVAITEREDGGSQAETIEGKQIQLQHESIRDMVLASINKDEKRKLAIQVYNEIKDLPGVHNDTLFALLAEAATNTSIRNTGFWTHYTARGNKALEDAHTKNSHGRAYGIAMTVLDDLEETAGKKTELQKALQLLLNPEKASEVPHGIKELLIKSLLTVVENGIFLGRFTKVHETIGILERTGEKKHMTKAYLLGFKGAYAQVDTRTMEAYAAKLEHRRDLTPGQRFEIELKLAFKKARTPEEFQACLESYKTKEKELAALKTSDLKLWAELGRLKVRITFEKVRVNLLEQGVDGDVLVEPSHFTADTSIRLIASEKELSAMDQDRRNTPGKFEQIEELYLLDQLASTNGYLGNYDKAIAAYSEVWRLAEQMGIPREAARAAKIKGDIQVMQGIAQIEFPVADKPGKATARRVIDRQKILQAISTYQEEGLPPMEKVDKDEYYQILVRCQSLRAIGILALSYKNEIAEAKSTRDQGTLDDIKQALAPHLKTALENFRYISSSKVYGPYLASEDGEFSYYIMSNLGHVMGCIEGLGINEAELETSVPDICNFDEHSKAFSTQAISNGLNYIKTHNMYDNVDEVDRKIDGYGKLIELGQNRAADTEKYDLFSSLKIQLKAIKARRSGISPL